ncbi:hypothetical protein [Natrinema caseinilyticum]|uniref:hypothetical protein n=1 Tax=Natrinema caseinilyticum TaxID=2961570 RepID=UPI0020C2D133|nr:hypothetical protein [Natrinema caseinilyticum]
MRANRKTLDEHLPAPGATWRWGDCSLSRSVLCTMRNRGLIEQRENGEWETTRRAWDALERYTSSEGNRGEIVGQQELARYVEEAKKR